MGQDDLSGRSNSSNILDYFVHPVDRTNLSFTVVALALFKYPISVEI
jgi:hypothetical protein